MNMKNEAKNLDQLKEANPFLVPEGYMEGLSSRIMDQLPAKTLVETKQVTLMDHVRPWLYLAAVFAGLGLFINLLVGRGEAGQANVSDSLLIGTSTSVETLSAIQAEDDADYLEYIETQYVSYILAEEIDNYE
jgi:hypothetical protein